MAKGVGHGTGGVVNIKVTMVIERNFTRNPKSCSVCLMA